MLNESGTRYTPPRLAFASVTFAVTGCVSAALMPFWVKWVMAAYPDMTINVTMSRVAQQFVSLAALRHLVNGSAILDAWDSASPGQPIHRELARDTEAWVVYPASLNSVSKLASGIADSPVLAAMQTTDRPIVIAPSFPEGALDNPIVVRRMDELRTRPNVEFVGGGSLTTGGIDMPAILDVLAMTSQRPGGSAGML